MRSVFLDQSYLSVMKAGPLSTSSSPFVMGANDGANGGNRTHDLRFTKPLLYR